MLAPTGTGSTVASAQPTTMAIEMQTALTNKVGLSDGLTGNLMSAVEDKALGTALDELGDAGKLLGYIGRLPIKRSPSGCEFQHKAVRACHLYTVVPRTVGPIPCIICATCDGSRSQDRLLLLLVHLILR